MCVGVEIWGWSEKKEIERIQGKFMKMIMEMFGNTQDHIWRRDMARTKMATTSLKHNKGGKDGPKEMGRDVQDTP